MVEARKTLNKTCPNFRSSALLTIWCLVAVTVPVGAQPASPPSELKPSNPPATVAPSTKPAASQPDTLLVMLKPGADKNEVADILREVNGTVIDTIGEGEMTTLVIRTEKGKLEETEKKLSKDEHFGAIQRNPLAEAHLFNGGKPNDPFFPSQWHLGALNVPAAWDISTGSGAIIAVADSGTQSTNPDLSGRTYAGIDTVQSGARGNVDWHATGSHGTAVATAAAATTNNGRLTAAPALGSFIFPIRIAWANGSAMTTSDDKIIQAINACATNGIRILNVSYGYSDTAYSYANARVHPVLHQWLKWYHDSRNGLVFFSAGNDNKFDPSPRLSYMMMVSSLDQRYGRSSFSNYGNCIWFTAPGSNIVISDRNGRASYVNGTSFASPLVASIAAMILARRPGMTNRQVEQALISSCSNVPGSTWNITYGYGLPNAVKALASFSRAIGDDEDFGKGDSEQQAKSEGPAFVIENEKDAMNFSDKETEIPKMTDGNEPTYRSVGTGDKPQAQCD